MRNATGRLPGWAAAAAVLLLSAPSHAEPGHGVRPRPVPVVVVNGADAPVPVVSSGPSEVHVLTLPAVQALLLPSKQPFQRELYIEVPSGTMSASTSFLVPAGRRLVIEWIGGSTRVSSWENVRLTVRTVASGDSVGHDVGTDGYRRDFAGSDPPINPDYQVRFGQMVKLYADPGTSVSITALRSESAEITPTGFALSLSGYLVPCGDDPACPIP